MSSPMNVDEAQATALSYFNTVEQAAAGGGAAQLPHAVFSCLSCRTVLTDSSYVVAHDTQHGVASFSAVVPGSVHVADTVELSTEGSDAGCTFCVVQCSSCSNALGRLYKSTPAALDGLRDTFTMLMVGMSAYELGKLHVASGGVGGVLDPQASLRELLEHKMKALKLLLLFDQRITALEKQV